MADTVEGYLAQLRAALAGADPALVQDALYDAEEYLRAAIAEGDGSPEAVEAAVEAYGTPVAVATGAGEDEVRAWPIPAGATAVEAAGKIHTDLARGFIKAETIAYEDLRATGSMREAKAANTARKAVERAIILRNEPPSCSSSSFMVSCSFSVSTSGSSGVSCVCSRSSTSSKSGLVESSCRSVCSNLRIGIWSIFSDWMSWGASFCWSRS